MTQKGQKKPWRLSLSIAFSLFAHALVARPAVASDAPVVLSATPCEDIDQAELSRLLHIELGVRLDTATSAREGYTMHVECQAGSVQLVVTSAHDERLRTLTRTDAAGEVGARLISLSLVEMLHEAERATTPAPPPVLAEPERPAPVPVRDTARSVRVLALLQVLTPRNSRTLSGIGLSADYLALLPFSARLETAFSRNERRYELGTTETELATLALAGGLADELGPVRARIMAGFRLGSARISGERAELPGVRASSVRGPWGGPLVSAGLGFGFFDTLALELGGELGIVTLPVVGEVEGDDDVALDEYWLSASVGLGATF